MAAPGLTLVARERPDGSIYLQGLGEMSGFHYILAPDESLAQALTTFVGLYREARTNEGRGSW